MSKLLTIAVPTFNRADKLGLLLQTLGEELVGYEALIELVISDNGSTDRTDEVIQLFTRAYPLVRSNRHPVNIGMDENFCTCMEMATGHYFWMFGDDDLPKRGVLRRIIELLQNESPDLLYLNSQWIPNVTSSNNGEPVEGLTTMIVSAHSFARKVNVWVTFISGMIINRKRMYELNHDLNLHRFSGTCLVHLGWILPLLMVGNRFQIIEQRCVLATSGNTGGYKLFTVFGSNFPKILNEVCGSKSPVYKAVMRSLIWSYIPQLIWISRYSSVNKFIAENILESLVLLKRTIGYWFIIMPIFILPKFIGIFALATAKLYGRFVRII